MAIIDTYDPLKNEMIQVIDKNGNITNPELEPNLSKDRLLKLYKDMVVAREADAKKLKLQRSGRMGTFAQSTGQEAAQIGAVANLKKTDWLVPSFRELPAVSSFGYPIEKDYLYYMGNEEGNVAPSDLNVTPVSVPVGTHILHATGIAWASKLKKEDKVTLCFFGDGATSEGDFHEAMNFAGVFKVPAVFVCQNNQYAISTPRKHQTASKTIAQKALAYGFKGIQVDGNDILAMYVVTKEAIEKARAGEGPTLIEAITYRITDHTTADYAKRYRSDDEVAEWKSKDPILRFTNYLKNKSMITDDEITQILQQAETLTQEAYDKALAFPKQTIDSLFDYLFKEPTPELLRQKDEMKKFVGSDD